MKEYYLQNYKEILNILLTFVGTILAIFFTLFALPIQNLLGKFSQDTVNEVLFDKIILGCFATLVFIFGYNFTLLFFDSDAITMSISIGTGYFSLIILSVLVLRVFYFLDIRNQIKSRAKRIISNLKKEKYESIDSLKKDIDYLFDFAQRSIQMDRFEYFSFTMNNLIKIANTYSVKIRNTSSYNEPFFMFATERFIDLRKSIKVDNHTKIMDSLVKCLGGFAHAAFNIKGTPDKFNFAVNIFVDDLKDIILSQEMLRETSTAPYSAISEIKNIALKSIENDYIGTTQFCIEKLCFTSTISSRLHINFGNYVATRANETTSLIVYKLFESLKAISQVDSMHLRKVLKEINETLKDFFEDDYEHKYETNIAPFYYPLSNYGFDRLLTNIINKMLSSEDDHYIYELLEQIEEFLSNLNQNIRRALKKGYFTEVNHILHQIYTFTIIFINFRTMYDGKNMDSYEIQSDKLNFKITVRSKICELLEKELLSIFYNPIYSTFETKSDNVPYWEYIDMYSSIIGILLCEQKKEGTFEGNDFEILEEWTDGLIKLIDKHKNNLTYEEIGKTWNKYEIIHPLKNIYYAIKLIGGWFYMLYKKFYFVRIQKILEEQPELTKEIDFMGFEADMIGFGLKERCIVDSRGSKKHLTPPSLVTSNFSNYNKVLFNVTEFEKYLEALNKDKKK
ncbi:MAG: hypothetical protein J0M37_12175 [Ignavibacteria bacterium]|nr:hypothetical protein [Ignavibacteria bacterium]